MVQALQPKTAKYMFCVFMSACMSGASHIIMQLKSDAPQVLVQSITCLQVGFDAHVATSAAHAPPSAQA